MFPPHILFKGSSLNIADIQRLIKRFSSSPKVYSIQFNDLFGLKNIQKLNMLRWTNISTQVINYSYDRWAQSSKYLDGRETVPLTSKISWHIHHKSHIQFSLSETGGLTNLCIDYLITVKAAHRGPHRLRWIHSQYICSEIWQKSFSGVLVNWQFYAKSPMILSSQDINTSRKLSNLFTTLTRMCGYPSTESNRYVWVFYDKLAIYLIAFCQIA